MQETAEFNNLQLRFSDYPKERIQGTVPTELGVLNAEKILIDRMYELLDLYFGNISFRENITLRFRQNTLEPQITTVLNLFDQAIQNRAQGTFQPNRQGIIDGIQDQITDLEKQFTPYLVRDGFISSLKNAPAEVNEILNTTKIQGQKTVKNIDDIYNNVKDASIKVSKLIDTAVGSTLGDYFHKCYNGRSIADQEDWDNNKKQSTNSINSAWTKVSDYYKENQEIVVVLSVVLSIFACIMLYIFIPKIIEFFSEYREMLPLNTAPLHDYRALALLLVLLILGGILIYKVFDRKYPGGYVRSAASWFILTGFVLFMSMLLVIFKTDRLIGILNNPSATQSNNIIELVIANIIVLAIPAYAIRVCLVNYNASKHQAVLNLHRVNVLRTFPLILKESESNNNEQTRAVVYAALAESIFKPGATGHINRGQASDNSSQGFLKDLLN